MHFLIDASVPRSAGTVLKQLGHDATDVRDAGMRDAPDDIIAAYARDNHLVLVTRDFDFADIRNYPPSLYQGIVVLRRGRLICAWRWIGFNFNISHILACPSGKRGITGSRSTTPIPILWGSLSRSRPGTSGDSATIKSRATTIRTECH